MLINYTRFILFYFLHYFFFNFHNANIYSKIKRDLHWIDINKVCTVHIHFIIISITKLDFDLTGNKEEEKTGNNPLMIYKVWRSPFV
jgi:hypothetical protein